MLADFVFETILALLDLFHAHADPVELLDQVAHRARDRVGQLGVIEFGITSWRALSPSITLPGIPTIVDHGGARRHDHRARADPAAVVRFAPGRSPTRPR